MNSIESYSPPKASLLDTEEAPTLTDLGLDAGSLAALRALMGGIVPQTQTSFQSGLTPQGDSGSGSTSEKLASLLEGLLEGGSLPPELAGLVTTLKKTLDDSGDACSNPDAVAQMKTLLQKMESTATQELLSDSQSTQAQTLLDVKQALTKALTESMAQQESRTGSTLPPVNQGVEVPPEGSNTLGNAILQSLGSQSSTGGAAPLTGVDTTARIEQVSTLMSQMADRVLVTDPLHGQMPEVRIKLADSVMPGTEVRVWREEGGQLRVEFDTVSPYWARVLNEASPLLAQRLNERLQVAEPVQVTVQQQGGQPEDGRSRNRQSPWDLAQLATNEQ